MNYLLYCQYIDRTGSTGGASFNWVARCRTLNVLLRYELGPRFGCMQLIGKLQLINT
jgi:hypothetical protein